MACEEPETSSSSPKGLLPQKTSFIMQERNWKGERFNQQVYQSPREEGGSFQSLNPLPRCSDIPLGNSKACRQRISATYFFVNLLCLINFANDSPAQGIPGSLLGPPNFWAPGTGCMEKRFLTDCHGWWWASSIVGGKEYHMYPKWEVKSC